MNKSSPPTNPKFSPAKTIRDHSPIPEPDTPEPKPRPFELSDALADPQLFAGALGPPGTWGVWFTILRAFYGLPLSPEETEVFSAVSGNRAAPEKPCTQLWAVAGRRSGKSRIAAAIAAYSAVLAVLAEDNGLAPGEVGHILAFSPTRAQAKTVLEYAAAFLEQSPLLHGYVESRTNEELRLKGNIAISVLPASFRHLRGRSVLAAVLDESAFFRSDESANPDIEIYRALLPALKPGAPLIGISSPFSKRGLLWERFKAAFGRSDPGTLVIRADTETLNPTYDPAKIAEAYELDPVSAKSEFGAQFRSDLSTYIDEATLRRCVSEEAYHLLPDRAIRYFGFVDVSGGASDSFCLGISHVDGEKIILDTVHEWPSPFSPDDIVDACCEVLGDYHIPSVSGDRYAGAWVSDSFRQRGINYMPSKETKSELYVAALPLFTGQTAILPNNPGLITQLCNLERRTGPSGREIVDHPRGGFHDDIANAAAGALVTAAKTRHRTKRKPVDVQGMASHDILGW